jgi:gas vesicle protein
MVDTSNMSDHEWTVLGRLLKNFPGANIRMLAFVSESQLEVIDSVLNKLDGQVYRWILTSPTPEYLEALLEMGKQYNYQSETQQMAAAMGYNKRQQQPTDDLIGELDALDAHLESLQSNQPRISDPIETTPAPSESDYDFDADLNALLGAIKQSHGIEDDQPSPVTDENPDTESEQPTNTPHHSAAKTPSRRLIWATGITGVVLILVALFAPWEQPEAVDTQVQISPRTFSTKTESDNSQPVQQSSGIAAQNLGTQKPSPVTRNNPNLTDSADETPEVAELNRETASQIGREEPQPLETNAQWNDDMARILAAETGNIASVQKPNSEDAQRPESIETDGAYEPNSTTIADSEIDGPTVAAETVTDIPDTTDHTEPTLHNELDDSAEQRSPESASVEPEIPKRQPATSNETKSGTPLGGTQIIQAASSSAYFIQLGVYANPTQALLFIDTLPAEANAFQVRLNKSGRKLSTVLSGPFDSKTVAEATAASVLRESDVWIRSAGSVKAELVD